MLRQGCRKRRLSYEFASQTRGENGTGHSVLIQAQPWQSTRVPVSILFSAFFRIYIHELTTLFIQGKIKREGFLCFLKDLNYSVLNRLRIVRA